LRNENILDVALDAFIAEKQQKRFTSVTLIPEFTQRLSNTRQYFTHLEQAYTHEEWSQKFSDLLNLMGWPGERSLNSEEYQVASRWNDLLDEFSQLDFISEKITIHTAVNRLHHLASNTVFQTQTPES